MATDLITMQCIEGEEWPITGFKSFVNTLDSPLTTESITFHCPLGHKFTLQKALSKDIFTEEQAQKILTEAKKIQEEHQKRDWSVYQVSDFIPDEKLMALNLPCMRCGKAAQRKAGDLSKVFCLECYTDWLNYDRNAHNVLGRTYGRPYELLWKIIFDRFLKKLPPLEPSEAEELLEECRKKARRISSERSQ